MWFVYTAVFLVCNALCSALVVWRKYLKRRRADEERLWLATELQRATTIEQVIESINRLVKEAQPRNNGTCGIRICRRKNYGHSIHCTSTAVGCVRKYKEIDVIHVHEATVCTICMDNLKLEKCIATPCGHQFHEECATRYARSLLTVFVCPICRWH